MAYEPQFTIRPRLLTLVEVIAALRERILGAAVELSWIPALQKDSRTRNGHASTAEIWAMLAVSRQGAMDLLRPLLEAGLVEKIGKKKDRSIFPKTFMNEAEIPAIQVAD